MSSSNQMMAEQALAAYRQRRENLADLQQKLGEVSASVTAKRKVVTVTVGRQGQVTGVTFPSAAYKNLTPSELAKVVMQTIDEAREQVVRRSAELLAPVLPDGFPAPDLVNGTADLRVLTSSEPRRAADVLERIERETERS
jgi:DNA-binding protein YbaB